MFKRISGNKIVYIDDNGNVLAKIIRENARSKWSVIKNSDVDIDIESVEFKSVAPKRNCIGRPRLKDPKKTYAMRCSVELYQKMKEIGQRNVVKILEEKLLNG